MSPEILTSFFVGLFGSFHCIGMCGPIAIALPIPNSNNLSFVAGRLLYNLGRVVTYSFLGAVFGLLGSRLVISGFQQSISIVLGVGIVTAVLIPPKYKAKITQHKFVQKITLPLKSGISGLFKSGTFSAMFLIGILNGFLPCGLVYVALAGAIVSGDAISGSAVMILFGLGTIPTMFAATIFGKFINLNIRRKISKAIPVFALILGLLFIVRGMGLGIPYISPKISAQVVNESNLDCR
jgi:sulfite exporter TauE/SafE